MQFAWGALKDVVKEFNEALLAESSDEQEDDGNDASSVADGDSSQDRLESAGARQQERQTATRRRRLLRDRDGGMLLPSTSWSSQSERGSEFPLPQQEQPSGGFMQSTGPRDFITDIVINNPVASNATAALKNRLAAWRSATGTDEARSSSSDAAPAFTTKAEMVSSCSHEVGATESVEKRVAEFLSLARQVAQNPTVLPTPASLHDPSDSGPTTTIISRGCFQRTGSLPDVDSEPEPEVTPTKSEADFADVCLAPDQSAFPLANPTTSPDITAGTSATWSDGSVLVEPLGNLAVSDNSRAEEVVPSLPRPPGRATRSQLNSEPCASNEMLALPQLTAPLSSSAPVPLNESFDRHLQGNGVVASSTAKEPLLLEITSPSYTCGADEIVTKQEAILSGCLQAEVANGPDPTVPPVLNSSNPEPTHPESLSPLVGSDMETSLATVTASGLDESAAVAVSSGLNAGLAATGNEVIASAYYESGVCTDDQSVLMALAQLNCYTRTPPTTEQTTEVQCPDSLGGSVILGAIDTQFSPMTTLRGDLKSGISFIDDQSGARPSSSDQGVIGEVSTRSEQAKEQEEVEGVVQDVETVDEIERVAENVENVKDIEEVLCAELHSPGDVNVEVDQVEGLGKRSPSEMKYSEPPKVVQNRYGNYYDSDLEPRALELQSGSDVVGGVNDGSLHEMGPRLEDTVPSRRLVEPPPPLSSSSLDVEPTTGGMTEEPGSSMLTAGSTSASEIDERVSISDDTLNMSFDGSSRSVETIGLRTGDLLQRLGSRATADAAATSAALYAQRGQPPRQGSNSGSSRSSDRKTRVDIKHSEAVPVVFATTSSVGGIAVSDIIPATAAAGADVGTVDLCASDPLRDRASDLAQQQAISDYVMPVATTLTLVANDTDSQPVLSSGDQYPDITGSVETESLGPPISCACPSTEFNGLGKCEQTNFETVVISQRSGEGCSSSPRARSGDLAYIDFEQRGAAQHTYEINDVVLYNPGNVAGSTTTASILPLYPDTSCAESLTAEASTLSAAAVPELHSQEALRKHIGANAATLTVKKEQSSSSTVVGSQVCWLELEEALRSAARNLRANQCPGENAEEAEILGIPAQSIGKPPDLALTMQEWAETLYRNASSRYHIERSQLQVKFEQLQSQNLSLRNQLSAIANQATETFQAYRQESEKKTGTLERAVIAERGRVRALEAECLRLRQIATNEDNARSQDEERLEELEERLDDLTAQREHWVKLYESQMKKLRRMTDKADELQEKSLECETLQTQLEDANHKLTAAAERISHLVQQGEAFRNPEEENCRLRSTVAQQEGLIGRLEGLIRDANIEHERVVSEIQARLATQLAVTQQYQEQGSKVAELTAQLQASRAEATKLIAENGAIEQEKEKLTADNALLSNAVKSLLVKLETHLEMADEQISRPKLVAALESYRSLLTSQGVITVLSQHKDEMVFVMLETCGLLDLTPLDTFFGIRPEAVRRRVEASKSREEESRKIPPAEPVGTSTVDDESTDSRANNVEPSDAASSNDSSTNQRTRSAGFDDPVHRRSISDMFLDFLVSESTT